MKQKMGMTESYMIISIDIEGGSYNNECTGNKFREKHGKTYN